jgi:hypothetical protein
VSSPTSPTPLPLISDKMAMWKDGVNREKCILVVSAA